MVVHEKTDQRYLNVVNGRHYWLFAKLKTVLHQIPGSGTNKCSTIV